MTVGRWMDGVPTTNSGSTTVLQCHPVSPSRPVSAMPGRKIATARTNFSAATEKNTISTIRGWCPGARHHVSGSNGKNSIFLSTAAAAVSICWLADTLTTLPPVPRKSSCFGERTGWSCTNGSFQLRDYGGFVRSALPLAIPTS